MSDTTEIVSMAFNFAEKMLEKFMSNPDFTAKLHAQGRMHDTGLRASLDREAIRRAAKPPLTSEEEERIRNQHPDGILTDNPEDAQ